MSFAYSEQLPDLERLYKTYLETHLAALAHLHQLFSPTAHWTYSSDIQNLFPSGTLIPSLPSLLSKPKQRVPDYCLLLGSIIDTTPVSHSNFGALVEARDWMEKVARDLNNESKVAPHVPHIRTPTIPNMENGPANMEDNNLGQLEKRLHDYPVFLDTLAERAKDWGIAVRCSVESLQLWSITFGAVLGFPSSPSASYPPSYEAFISLLTSLSGLCTTLEHDIRTTLNPLLHELKAMTEHPKLRLKEMHALESSRSPSSLTRFWRSDTFKNHRRYLDLRSKLLSELPVLLDAMDRAIGLVVRMVIQGFLTAVREKWINLFNSLQEEGERYGGTEETLKAWRARWEFGRRMLLIWEESYVLGESAGRSEMSLPVRLSVTSAELPPANGKASDDGT